MALLSYTLILLFVIFLITTLPLHFAVKLMGGKTNLLKTFLVILLAAIVNIFIYALFPFASILSFLALIWIYRENFRLKWLKAFIVWLLQLIFIAIFSIIFSIAGLITLSSFLN